MSDTVRREQILKAAEKLLGRHGAAKTTVADLAREVGIAVGTVYLEFSSKEAIVEALSTEKHCRVIDAMRRAAAGEGSFAVRLRGIFDARTAVLLRYAEEGAHVCELVHCLSAAVKSAQTRFVEEETELLAGLLREGARAGQLVAPKPAMTARTLLRAYAVFSPPQLFELPRDQVRDALRDMHELVLNGLLGARARP
ncbi:MAG TPA: TetR/AcrR family transcriptional regulator [Polyangiaceae bacterium]|nr:TetR/AcrR family transcriptional regulator [Polyangiaceae bacterium]